MELRKDNRPILSFAKLKSVMPMPNLLDVQLRSFEKLVEQAHEVCGQTHDNPERRTKEDKGCRQTQEEFHEFLGHLQWRGPKACSGASDFGLQALMKRCLGSLYTWSDR